MHSDHTEAEGDNPSEPQCQEDGLHPNQTKADQLIQPQDCGTSMGETEEGAAEHKAANPVTASRPPIRPDVVGIKKAHRMNTSKFAPKELQKQFPNLKRSRAKKPVDAPKRPKSAYMFFLADFRAKFKEEHPDVKKVAAVGLAAGEAWRSLPADKRQEYDQMSLHSKAEYADKMGEYHQKNPKPPRKQQERPAEHIARPMSAYFCFLAEFRKDHKERFGPKPVSEVGCAAGAKWQGLTPEQRQPYEQASQQSRADYHQRKEAERGQPAPGATPEQEQQRTAQNAVEEPLQQQAVEEPLQQHDGAQDLGEAKAGTGEADTIWQPGSAEDASAAQQGLADPSQPAAAKEISAGVVVGVPFPVTNGLAAMPTSEQPQLREDRRKPGSRKRSAGHRGKAGPSPKMQTGGRGLRKLETECQQSKKTKANAST